MENRGYYQALLAETHAAQVNLLFPASASEFPFAIEAGRRLVWNIDLGKEIPLFGWETDLASKNDLPPGAFGLGLWLPVDFHMIEDIGTDPSNPIIDTDYRFSGMLKAQRGLAQNSSVCLGADTCRFGLRLQVGHESTHLGDEFSLAAELNHPNFERINVSYEYWELGASMDFDIGEGELTTRGGVIRVIDPDKGWYSFDLAETNNRIIPLSSDPSEWYLGLQWEREERWSTGLLPWLFRKEVGYFLSLEAKERNVYDYQRINRDVPEDERWSFNVMMGLRPARAFLEKGVPDIYLRWYEGVNPFGQFRSQRNFRMFGFGIHVDM